MGLNADWPLLTLPTVQYQVPTVQGPLMGETHGWLLDSVAAVDLADVKEDLKTPELNGLRQEDCPKSIVPLCWF